MYAVCSAPAELRVLTSLVAEWSMEVAVGGPGSSREAQTHPRSRELVGLSVNQEIMAIWSDGSGR
jgi:hypothetical protein